MNRDQQDALWIEFLIVLCGGGLLMLLALAWLGVPL